MDDTLTKKILFGFTFGIIFGVIFNYFNIASSLYGNYLINFLDFGGIIFLKTIKMMVVPIVFFSLSTGVSNLSDISSLGRIGFKTILLYITTTIIAITASLTISNFINPGNNIVQKKLENLEIESPPSFLEILIDIIPENPFKSLIEGNMLQVIFIAILVGASISLMSKENLIKKNFIDFNDVIMKILSIIMYIAPLGIFCLIAKTFSTQGLSSILELLKYFFIVVLVIFLHLFFVYLPIVKIIGKTSYRSFIKGIKEAILFAFSTSSSTATIPITLQNLKKNFNVRDKISSFTVPLGATINMDGTAIMQGVATVFIANLYGIELQVNDFVTIIMTATLASIGTAGVPGVGIIMLGMVLNQVGLPLEGIAIVMGVDRFLDMLRTSLNVSGDAMVTIVVDKTEKS